MTRGGSAAPHARSPVLTAGAPLAEASLVVIALHGRGGNAEEMLRLAQIVSPEGAAVLAPQADGRSWYPLSFLAPRGENQPHLDGALARVASLVDEAAAHGVPASSVALLGFSQGACLACEFAASQETPRIGGVAAIIGGLIGAEHEVRQTAAADLSSLRAALLTADPDPHVPAARVAHTARVLRDAGTALDHRVTPGGAHTVQAEDAAAVRDLLGSMAG